MSLLSNNTLAGSSGQGGAAGYAIDRSLRFNSGDSAYLNRQPSSAGNRTVWTWSGWVKRGALATTSSRQVLFSAYGASNDTDYFEFGFENNTIYATLNSVASQTTAVFRDASAWLHYFVRYNGTNIKWYINGEETHTWAKTGNLAINGAWKHEISRGAATSTRYYDGYLADIHFIDGQALAASDFGEYDDNNVWQPKEFEGTYGTNGFHLDFSDNSTNAALGTDTSGNSNTWTVNNLSAAGSAWDQSQTWSNNVTNASGTYGAASQAFDGSLTTHASPSNESPMTYTNPSASDTVISTFEIYIDIYSMTGITLELNSTDITSQVSTTAQWHTITGFSGQNFSNLKWNANSSNHEVRVKAVKVNGEILVDAGVSDPLLAGIDALRDSPSQIADQTDTGIGGEVVGNYATWNPNGSNDSYITYSNGNLDFTQASSTGNASQMAPQATIGVSSGKWYWEFTNTSGSNNNAMVAASFCEANTITPSAGYVNYYGDDGTFEGAVFTLPSTASSYGANDIIGVALDADNGTVEFFKNGVSQGTATNGPTNVSLFPSSRIWTSNTSGAVSCNFGQRAFAYTAPSGYKALCTANLPEPTIADGSTAFDTKLWTGNGSTQTVSGLNFSPDFLWYKSRSVAHHHGLQNTVTGVGKSLSSSNTAAEYTETTGLDAFTSDGFNLDGDGYYSINRSGHSMVGWAWDAGSSNTTIAAGSSNSSAYNQSEVWSDMCSPAPSAGTYVQGFDGNTGSVFAAGISAGAYFTFTPTGGLTFSDSIRVRNGAVGGASYKYNGGTATSFPSNAWTTVATGGGTMTSFGVTRSSTDVHGWFAIEVDGKILVDSGLTPATNVPSIASTVRANPSAGFSIVTATISASGTIGHGLNTKPHMVIRKSLNVTSDWYVAVDIGSVEGYILLNSTASLVSASQNFSSTTFNAAWLGNSGETWVNYCFAPVEGYSAFGKFSGNSNTDGPFQYCGFKPRFLLLKGISAARDWIILDTERDTGNVGDSYLHPNSSGAENTYAIADILSNGFKMRYSGGLANNTGEDYIWAAFASHPFKTSRAN